MIVGLTGGIGSGKTTVAELFKQFDNVAIYIADIEAKKLMRNSEVIKDRLITVFGNECFVEGELNRPFLAKIVFNNKEQLNKLNSIVHPEVQKHFKQFLKANSNKDYVLYENAILFETGNHLFCDCIIAVYVDLETRIQRIISRDKVSKTQVLARIQNQWNEDKKILQSNYIIHNKNLNFTKKQVIRIHNILTKRRV